MMRRILRYTVGTGAAKSEGCLSLLVLPNKVVTVSIISALLAKTETGYVAPKLHADFNGSDILSRVRSTLFGTKNF